MAHGYQRSPLRMAAGILCFVLAVTASAILIAGELAAYAVFIWTFIPVALVAGALILHHNAPGWGVWPRGSGGIATDRRDSSLTHPSDAGH